MKKKDKKDTVEVNIKEEIKKDKKKPRIKPKKKSKLKIIIIVVVCILLLAATVYAIYYHNLVLIKDKIILESGTSIKNLEKRFIEKQGNLKIKKIEYTNLDDKVKDKNELATLDIYLDAKGNKVDRDKACDKKDDEYILKKGYKLETHLINVYSYNVKIIATDSRVFKSKLILKDTQAPKLTVKQSVEITEGDEIKAEMFLSSYEDASNMERGEIYFVKEVKVEEKENKEKDDKKAVKTTSKTKTVNNLETLSNDKKETKDTEKETKVKYEKYELTADDKKVGEHELLVVVEDPSKNVSEPAKVKLVVKEKPTEPEEEVTSSGSSSSGRRYTGGSSSSGGYSSGSSSVGTLRTEYGRIVTQGQLFAYWGPGGYTPAKRQSAGALFDSIFPNLPDITECNIHFGCDNLLYDNGICVDWGDLEDVYNSNMEVVGLYSNFYMTYCPKDDTSHGYDCPKYGEGYLLPSGVVYSWRNF